MEKQKEQWRQKLMTLMGCVTHTQVVADQGDRDSQQVHEVRRDGRQRRRARCGEPVVRMRGGDAGDMRGAGERHKVRRGERKGVKRTLNKKIMEDYVLTISVKELLKVMDKKTYRRLISAGRLSIARVTPNAEVYVDSIPIRFRLRMDGVCQSREAYSPRSRLETVRTLEELERQRRNLLSLVCRILRAHHKYKLRPSELAVENVGDLSWLSRETRAFLYTQMQKEHPVRTAIDDI